MNKAATLNVVIKGWTNPIVTTNFAFTAVTKYSDGGTQHEIDSISGFEISSVQGECTVSKVNVTDGDTRIWAEPKNYTFMMTCNHDFLPTYGIRITLPIQYTLYDRARCIFGRYKTRYDCQVFASERKIIARSFTDSTIKAGTLFHFTVDSIRNPGQLGATDDITIETIDQTDSQVDVGKWKFLDGYYKHGNITTFEVTPLSDGLGKFPVNYRFHIVPNGEICQECYFWLEIPPEIEVIDRNAFEYKCASDYIDILDKSLDCTINPSNSSQVKI